MNILKWLIGIVIVLAIVFFGGAYLLPRDVAVERSITIKAPPDKVFAHLNDLKKFNAWSPWAKKDPAARYAFEGPEQGVGQKMTWTSSELGNGSQTISESVENRRVGVGLDFGGMGKAQASYDLAPVGDATAVTWGFKSDLGDNPVKRWMGLMFDRWIGKDYEQGLASLKEVVEKENPR